MQQMQLKIVILAFFAVGGAALRSSLAKLDINQKVYIENQAVLGDGSGEGALNECQNLAPQFVSNPDAPKVKVCGTGIKATVYLRGRCEEYHDKQWTIGACDTTQPTGTCASLSPADDARMGASQSYKIENC